MAVEVSKTNLYIGEGDPSPSGVRVSKTNLYLTGDTGIYNQYVTFPAGSSDAGDQLYLAEFDSQAPTIELRDFERNPYRAHLGEDDREIKADFKEQQRVLREQHNKTQAGDTTFDYGLLLKTYPNKEFTLGSLGRFFHDDYGLIIARFVQFTDMSANDWQGQPVGRRKANTEGVDWVVTNDFAKSDTDLILGFCFSALTPDDDTYGWAVVSGPNPAAIRAVGSRVAVKNDAYTWVSTGGIGLDEAGTILGRRWTNAASIGIPAGSLFIKIEGRSDAALEEMVNEWLAPTIAQVEEHETRLDGLDAWRTTVTTDIAALEAADVTLNTRIAREELLRAREIQALRNQFVTVDFVGLLNDLRVEITEAYTLADQPAFNLATNAMNLATALQIQLNAIDLSALGELAGIASSLAAIDAKFDGMYFDNTATPTVADQVHISTLVGPNADGNYQVVMVPIDFVIDSLLDVDTTTSPPAVDDLLQFDGTDWIPFTLILDYSLPFGFTTATTASEVMLLHSFAEAVDFPANFAGSTGFVGGNPASTFTFTVAKGTPGSFATVGTITVSTGGVVAFTTSGGVAVSFAAGDSIRVTAQAGVEAAMLNCGFTFLGIRA